MDLYENTIEKITFTNMMIKFFVFFFLVVLLEEAAKHLYNQEELLFLFASQAR